MAMIAEQFMVFKVSKLVKGSPSGPVLSTDVVAALEQLVSEAIANLEPAAIVELEATPTDE